MVNRQTVHHSWSLFERNKDSHPEGAYGDKFRYDAFLKTPGPISALFVDFSILLFVAALLISPVSEGGQVPRDGGVDSLGTDTLDFEVDVVTIWDEPWVWVSSDMSLRSFLFADHAR